MIVSPNGGTVRSFCASVVLLLSGAASFAVADDPAVHADTKVVFKRVDDFLSELKLASAQLPSEQELHGVDRWFLAKERLFYSTKETLIESPDPELVAEQLVSRLGEGKPEFQLALAVALWPCVFGASGTDGLYADKGVHSSFRKFQLLVNKPVVARLKSDRSFRVFCQRLNSWQANCRGRFACRQFSFGVVGPLARGYDRLKPGADDEFTALERLWLEKLFCMACYATSREDLIAGLQGKQESLRSALRQYLDWYEVAGSRFDVVETEFRWQESEALKEKGLGRTSFFFYEKLPEIDVKPMTPIFDWSGDVPSREFFRY